MAEGTVYNIVDKIFWDLKSPALKQIGSAWGITEELRKLDDKLLIIRGLVLDAEEKQMGNEDVGKWLRKLKDVVYDADDVLDDVGTQAFRRQVEIHGSIRREVGYFFTRSNPFKFCFGIVCKIKGIRERVDEIVNDRRGLGLKERVLEWQVDIRGGRNKTNTVVPFWGFRGRQADKEAIGEMLEQDNDDEVSVVSIVGEGGLGKTTLAQKFYEYWNVDEFDIRTWVCVFEDFDIEKIMGKMVGDDGLDEQQLKSCLQEKLRGKKFFLVLDGVCNEHSSRWTKLLDMLTIKESASGSKILVTTRSKRVVLIMGTVRRHNVHYIDRLDDSDCLTLFSVLAHGEGEEVEQELAYTRKRIVETCEGVPLAVRTLGGLLYSKTKQDCISLDDSLDDEQWEENDILPSLLKLCYNRMPSYLKQCVAYCALFPKNEEIHRDTFVHLWMAQGFIESSDKDDELEDIGHRYFDELVRRSFFIQVYQEGELAGTLYVMHDLVHELARSVAGSECLTISSIDTASLISQRTRHVLLGAPLKQNIILTPLLQAKKLRTLSIPGEKEPGLESSISTFISSFRYLRVLIFRLLKFELLPSSISNLKHLRYLSFSRNGKIQTTLPSSICKLLTLQTLVLSCCGALSSLPKDFGKLINLRHLEISSAMECLPEEAISCLSSLRTLSILRSSELKTLPKEMQHLSRLRSLVVDVCPKLDSLPKSIRHLTALENLHIGRCPELNFLEDDLQGLKSLQRFSLIDLPKLVRLPSGLQHSAATLQWLCVKGCPDLASLNYLENLTSLQRLEIINCPDLFSLPDEGMQRLKSLRVLRINGCPHLSKSCVDMERDMPKIKHVDDFRLDYKLIERDQAQGGNDIPSGENEQDNNGLPTGEIANDLPTDENEQGGNDLPTSESQQDGNGLPTGQNEQNGNDLPTDEKEQRGN